MEKINQNNINISVMSVEDIKEVLELQSDLNEDVINKNTINDEIHNSNYVNYIMKYNNEIIGYAQIIVIDNTMDLNAIVIKKEYRCQGLATFFLNYIINNNKANEIFLEVRKSNTNAQKLYEKLGFILINTRKNYYTDTNEDAYIYMKTN